MLDERILSFLKLCQLMNYRRTAEALHLTQPAVSQHIRYLEQEYGCRLFNYEGRRLSKTPQCEELEKHALSVLYNEKSFREQLRKTEIKTISVGATKTIGDYAVEEQLFALLRRPELRLEFIVDNTENLLAGLDSLRLDLLLIEGFFDKERYSSRLIRREELLGICAPDHPFAGRRVPLKELFGEHILLREEGSGTRAVFEEFLREKGYLIQAFPRRSVISSFKLIEHAVMQQLGISFVYQAIPASNPNLGVFRLQGGNIFHEFNYVFLKGSNIQEKLELLGL